MSLKESADVIVETNSDSLKQQQNGPSSPLSPSLQNALRSLLENKLMSVEDMYKLAREFVKGICLLLIIRKARWRNIRLKDIV